MLSLSMCYCQSSTQDGYLLIHHSQFLRSSGTGLNAIWETCSTPCFHMDYSAPQEAFPWPFPQHVQFSVLHWDVRPGLCCLPVGDNLITAHGAGGVSCLPGPASPRLEPQSTHLSWDPLPLVLREIFARPWAAWASKLTRPWRVFPAAGQALEDTWLTGSWDVSDPPTSLHHVETALHSLLTSLFSPWFPQTLRVMT